MKEEFSGKESAYLMEAVCGCFFFFFLTLQYLPGRER